MKITYSLLTGFVYLCVSFICEYINSHIDRSLINSSQPFTSFTHSFITIIHSFTHHNYSLITIIHSFTHNCSLIHSSQSSLIFCNQNCWLNILNYSCMILQRIVKKIKLSKTSFGIILRAC